MQTQVIKDTYGDRGHVQLTHEHGTIIMEFESPSTQIAIARALLESAATVLASMGYDNLAEEVDMVSGSVYAKQQRVARSER